LNVYTKPMLIILVFFNKILVRGFNYEELTHLLYNILDAGVYLQENGIAHGDYRPCYLFMTKSGHFKLADRMNDDVTIEQNQMSNLSSDHDLYLSPLLFSGLSKNNLNIKHCEYKSDVFSLGLTILEAGLLRPVKYIYDRKSAQINQGTFDDMKEEFANKYSENPLLVTTLGKMLEIEESHRPDFISIKTAIPSYDQIIAYFVQNRGSCTYESDLTDPNLIPQNGHPAQKSGNVVRNTEHHHTVRPDNISVSANYT